MHIFSDVRVLQGQAIELIQTIFTPPKQSLSMLPSQNLKARMIRLHCNSWEAVVLIGSYRISALEDKLALFQIPSWP